MQHWDNVLPGKTLAVAYEHTIQDRELQARRMLDWIGLPWGENCLDHTQAEGIVRTASVSQARQPLYLNSVARWKKYDQFLAGVFQQISQS